MLLEKLSEGKPGWLFNLLFLFDYDLKERDGTKVSHKDFQTLPQALATLDEVMSAMEDDIARRLESKK